MSILPIVVLYDVDFHETNVYRTLLKLYPEKRILIYENSHEPHNMCYRSKYVSYHHNPQNGGVSAAYNYGAVLARELGDVDAVLLLDEDTRFGADYFSVLQAACDTNPSVNLFVPQLLYGAHKPFSPIRRRLCKRRGAFLDEGLYSLKNYLPVNSGACVRLSAFEQAGGYNPNIRLDFADFDFFSRLATISDTFCRVGSIAFQSFSNEEKQVDKLFRRYQFYIEGACGARSNRQIRSMVGMEVARHTLALTVRTHSLRFINYLIQQLQ